MNISKVLVTGGTGSFGTAFIKLLLDTNIEKIICLSRDELKQHEMRIKFDDPRLEFILGDVRDFDTVLESVKRVDSVFHAAALKHVPESEKYPWEFIKTNVYGSHNVIRALSMVKGTKGVFLSTDKAVEPVNLMGITKASMEKLVYSYAENGSINSCVTRYGNVLGSRGSVIPQFIKNIKNDEFLQVTDLSMTRFIMTLKESIDLVLYALESGMPGELLVQKSPAVSIEILVKALEMIFGKSKVKINVTGARPGEKFHETLLTAQEFSKSRSHEKFMRVHQEFETSHPVNKNTENYTSQNTNQLSASELAEIIYNDATTKNLL
jgi:UDP-N-acetylglucosamine 4,6-dehydratase